MDFRARPARRKDKDCAHDALPAIGRWKMLDNLRRTLSAPVAVLALLAGWTAPFDAALVWTIFVLSTIVMPTFDSGRRRDPPAPPRDHPREPYTRARR